MSRSYRRSVETGHHRAVLNENVKQGPVHYIPHHPVVTPGRTTKIRIVYDASAKQNRDERSFNECLFRGPVLLPDLCGLLLRFRLNKLGIIADIAKAFLQMGLLENQRDVTRFFWVKNIEAADLLHPNNLVVYRFKRVLFGAKASPSMLNLTVDHHLSLYGTDVAEMIRKNIYVDNLISGANDCEQAVQLYQQSKKMFNDASMNLREWISNSEEVMAKIPEADHASKLNPKVLGLQWNLDKDAMAIPVKLDKFQKVSTKRDVVEAVATVFDPLGMVSPVTLGAKCFVQQLWKENFAWDDKLPLRLV